MESKTPPVPVIVIAAFVWLTGAWGLVHTGRMLWRVWGGQDFTAVGGTGVVITAVVIAFIINLIIISLSSALLRGSSGARVIITIALILQLIASIWALVTAGADQITAIGAGIATGINAIALIGLLFFSGDHFKRTSVA